MQRRAADSEAGLARDSVWMRRLIARDATALAEIANACGHIPFGIAFRLLADRAEAEDIAQETLIRLWTYAERWQIGRPIAPWLRQVATHLAIDHIRRARRIRQGDVPERADPAASPEAALASADVRDRVAACIAALPERQRAAIILTYYEEQGNRQVADMLAMGLKAFESMLLRARQMLRSCLVGQGLLAADMLDDRP